MLVVLEHLDVVDVKARREHGGRVRRPPNPVPTCKFAIAYIGSSGILAGSVAQSLDSVDVPDEVVVGQSRPKV
jgi:hypothetical protein